MTTLKKVYYKSHEKCDYTSCLKEAAYEILSINNVSLGKFCSKHIRKQIKFQNKLIELQK